MVEFSVHLITYNNEAFIRETLDSILNQELDFNYEIVVGDDCSDDATLQIIRDYSGTNPGLFKIEQNQSQLGILKNFKATLDRCRGTYVFPIAGDDYFSTNDALQTMYNAINTSDGIGFTDCGFDEYKIKEQKKNSFVNRTNILLPERTYKKKILLGQIPPLGFCYNRKLLMQLVDFEGYINQGTEIDDYPLQVDLVMNSNFKRINKSLLVYRIHDQSYSHQQNFDKQLNANKEMKRLFDHFSVKYDFDEHLIKEYDEAMFKNLLLLSGYFSKRETGQHAFKSIINKSFIDYIHYWASQNKVFRKLISII